MQQQRARLLAYAVLALCICYSYAQQCQVIVPLGMQDRVYGIPDQNITASSYFSSSTAPYYARLYYSLGAGAWTSNVMDNQQYLQVAVGRKVITGFAVQGRRGSNEFVTQLYLQFSDDPNGQNWLTYQDIYGQPFLFQAPATQTDDVPVQFSLTYPVVAQYVRFVPFRWQKLISMRVELYGCVYETWGMVFDGATQLVFQNDQNNQQFESYKDLISLRFKTITTNGLLLYASSTQGDYLAVELWKGQLVVSINLGPSIYLKGDNSMIAGSLLDDGRWHDVRIVRNMRMINVSVDRVMVWQDVIGDFYALDINQNVTVGGLTTFFNKNGLHVKNNFTGCMENVMFDSLNMFRDAQYQAMFAAGAKTVTSNMNTPVSNVGRYVVYGSPSYSCLLADTSTQYPISFQTADAGFSVSTTIGQTLSVSFQFRTFQPGGTLIYTQMGNSGSDVWITLTADCFVYYEINTAVSTENVFTDTVQNDNVNTGNIGGSFCDGLWHTISLTTSKNYVQFIYDGQTRASSQTLTIGTGTVFYVAGGNPGYDGFQGCLRSLYINTLLIDFTQQNLQTDRVVLGTCVIRDRCLPNPCEHGGVCYQDWTSFRCDCTNTNYTGGVCHISQYPSSCVEAQMYSQTQNSIVTLIDLDGNGPLIPFNVTCAFPSLTSTNAVLNNILTTVSHDAQNLLLVQNYQNAGSYSKTLNYQTTLDNLNNLIMRSLMCRQQITYQCQNAKLFATPPTTEGGCGLDQANCYSKTYGWWVGRTGYPLNYWGGSAPMTGKCSCGVTMTCKVSSGSTGGGSGGVGSTNPIQTCNCDAPWTGDANTWLIDDGYLTYTPDLPVTQIRLGDTGAGGTQSKKSQYSVGALECYGDSLFDQPVTFRRTDANIEFPPLWGSEAFDIKFQFKTTNVYGVFLQDIGPNDYIDVRMTQANRILFQFDAGSGVQVIQAITGNNLNDNKWHTIQIERNRLQASLQVDFQAPITLAQGDLYFRPFQFNHNLSIGSSVIFDQGFAGCMRAFTVNGNIYSLYNKVSTGQYTYGLSLGCVPKCTPNPCQYNGECQEFYYSYYCECGRTPARGYICGREVGVNMQSQMMVKYTFPDTGSNVGSVDEYIKIGFSTQLKQGILMQIINPSIQEYMTIYVNGNGGITVEFNFGFGRYEVSTQIADVDFTNGQLHLVIVSRSNLGKVVNIQVDDYQMATIDLSQWLLSGTSDTRLDNPTYIYIGRNETTPAGRGFQGCVYQAQFNNIFPLKAAFNDPTLSYVQLLPDPSLFLEDKCGIEELLPANAPYEVRPLPTPPSNISLLYTGPSISMGSNQGAIVGGVIGGVFLILIIGLFLFCRAYKLETGAYRTYEEKGDEADTAEAAIRIGETGQPEVGERNEWFI